MPRKRKTRIPDVGAVEVPIYTRATVIDNGLIGGKPPRKTVLEKNPDIPDPLDTEMDIYALNTLQLHRTMPLEPASVQISMDSLIDNLPAPLQEQLQVAPCGLEYIFGPEGADVMDERIKQVYGRYDDFWHVFHRCEYVFWPIEVGKGHFVTGIFHLEKKDHSEAEQTPPTQYNIIESWSVVDPQRGPKGRETVARVKDTITAILGSRGVTFQVDAYKDDGFGESDDRSRDWALPWVPPADYGEDNEKVWESGIRAFALVKQLVGRVLDFYCLEMEHEDSFWSEPTCGWLNVDQVRQEMMGICAINALDDMKWYARLSVECIDRISFVEGIETFEACELAPDDSGKFAYYPGADEDYRIE
ncbi:hypothetical protein GGS20DRAFT_414953 [Poronia punctata]|nr:hypothetical protein GGS20DRAFT_414953 [Poronia punctata]